MRRIRLWPSGRPGAEPAPDLEARLRAAEQDVRRLERRRQELDRTLRAATGTLAAVQADLLRLRASRTWQWTHRTSVALRTLRGRPPKKRGSALDTALARIAALDGAATPGPPPPLPGGAAAPPARAQRAAPPAPRYDIPIDLGEREACNRFIRHYAESMGLSGHPSTWGDEALPEPADWNRVLVPSHRGRPTPGATSVDVVICVHNARDELRTCLWSLLRATGRPFHLVLVDDGSDEPTRGFLARFVARHPFVTLVTNASDRHGYTIAANLGLRASGGDVVVFLNSDTVVTRGWLDRLLGALDDDPRCGIAGPLSNAASHQSIPRKRDGDAWARNELPGWLNPEGMAFLLRAGGTPARPRVPFLNGFCLAIRRTVIDAIGEFDEERFGPGYCEENDYCARAVDAGFHLVVADDCFVAHLRNRSYGEAGRAALAKEHFRRFLDKHGEERIRARIEEMEAPGALDEVRERIERATRDPDATVEAFRAACPEPLSVGFVMPNMARGGSGGLHSVYQETSGMRRLGIDAVIFADAAFMDRARAAYADADELFVPYSERDSIEELTRGRDVLVGTHFQSLAMVAEVHAQRQDFLPAYYVQDYEPFFSVNVNGGSAASAEAVASYRLIPGMALFAKTHWICNAVGRIQGLPVSKVEPSIDETLYRYDGRRVSEDRPVRVLAMVRPRTWRRRPFATLTLLERLRSELGDEVEVSSFGCTDEALERVAAGHRYDVRHLGILTRAEVAAELKQTDIFLDVSVFQGMGRTAFEAMCCGCVPVLPRIGGTHEFARDDENAVLADTSDPAATYEALRALVADRQRIARLQEAGAEAGRRRSILAAVLSEYVLLEHEHARRFPARGARAVAIA